MMTEYQQIMFDDLASRVRWHAEENDITPIEVVGILELLKEDVMENTLIDDILVEEEEEEDDGEGWKQLE